LNGDCCSSQEEAKREAKQGFPESNLHFKFWLGTEFRANAVFRVKGFASRGCRDRHTGMFYVYVLHSTKDNGFYIGFSTDLKRLLSEHKQGASFATKSRGPWKLIYYEAYTEREDAEGREKFLKSGAGRRFLRAQLRHYLRVKGFASRGSDHDTPTLD
jgi:putative endonuclease